MLHEWHRIKRFIDKELPRGPGVVCVDLDSVLVYHTPDMGEGRLGRLLPFGLMLCQLLKQREKTVIVLTARSSGHVAIHAHLKAKGYPVENVTNVKPPAQCYVDDKALRVSKNWGAA